MNNTHFIPFCLLYFISCSAIASTTNSEELVVVGSHLPNNQQSLASSHFERDDYLNSGLTTLSDFLSKSGINIGAEFQTDPFSQNFSQTTANINLRGLGLGSTLVLIDGRRQTYSAALADDGVSFVDINSIPSVFIQQMDILKESAGSIYGSDAVAGVVNLTTRKYFEGFEISGSYQETDHSNQSDSALDVIYGKDLGDSHWVIAGSYFERTALNASERDFTAGTGISIVGSPGTYIPTNAFTPIMDSNCVAGGGIPNTRVGTCDFDFMPFTELIIAEERLNVAASLVTDLFPNHRLASQFSIAQAKADNISFSPSFPILDFVNIPDYHPGNVIGEDLIFVGRPLGATAPQGTGSRKNTTYRMVFDLDGKLTNNWHYNTGLQYSENHIDIKNIDSIRDNFQNALSGIGSNCDTNPSSCKFWNVFTDDSYAENLDLIDDVFSEMHIDRKTSLLTVDFSADTELGDINGKTISLALGAQYRRETLKQSIDENYLNQSYSFLLGGNEFDTHRNVSAVFSEFEIAWSDALRSNLAMRYEHYQGESGKLSPKLSLGWSPASTFTLTASISTAFRQPSIDQLTGESIVTLQEVSDLLGTSFTAVKPSGNSQLKPEESTAYNLKFTAKPIDDLTVSLDYWHFNIDDVIVTENAQAIVDAVNSGTASTEIIQKVHRNGLPLPTIQFVDVTYINSGEVITNGADLSASYFFSLNDYGNLIVKSQATYINKYDLTDRSTGSDKKISAVGNRNFTNFARSLPRVRANISLHWTKANHALSINSYYIHAYKNDQTASINADRHATIASQTTTNIQYAYTFPFDKNDLSLRIGINNIENKAPPYVQTNMGFDTKIHDPRGRMFYTKVSYQF